MQFEITAEQKKKAKAAHELFLSNLVGNHVLSFIAALGLFKTFWQPILLVPIISFAITAYTIHRAKKSLIVDDWFVMCHWQIAAKRCKVFAMIIAIGFTFAVLGWVGYAYLGMMKIAVIAMVGGVAILPVMVSVLVLIVMENDAMHLASHGKLPKSVYDRYPNEDVVVIEEPSMDYVAVETPIEKQASTDTSTDLKP